MKVYLDWRLSGDTAWLREYWPRVQLGLVFRMGARRLGFRAQRRNGWRAAQYL